MTRLSGRRGDDTMLAVRIKKAVSPTRRHRPVCLKRSSGPGGVASRQRHSPLSRRQASPLCRSRCPYPSETPSVATSLSVRQAVAREDGSADQLSSTDHDAGDTPASPKRSPLSKGFRANLIQILPHNATAGAQILICGWAPSDAAEHRGWAPWRAPRAQRAPRCEASGPPDTWSRHQGPRSPHARIASRSACIEPTEHRGPPPPTRAPAHPRLARPCGLSSCAPPNPRADRAPDPGGHAAIADAPAGRRPPECSTGLGRSAP